MITIDQELANFIKKERVHESFLENIEDVEYPLTEYLYIDMV